MDRRTDQYEEFQAPFLPVNLSSDFGFETPRRGPLLWPVIQSVHPGSVQSSPAPSSSSSSRPFSPIGSKSVCSQSPSPTPVVESLTSTSENTSKNSESAERITIAIRSGRMFTF